MKKVIKFSAWQTIYLVLCLGIILLHSSCFFRPIENDTTPTDGEPETGVHIKVRWGKYSKPEGEWLVFYPEDRSLKPFSREVGDDFYVDDLLPGRYKLLLLGMAKADPKVEFCNIDEPEQAMIKLLETGSQGEITTPEVIFSCTAAFNFAEDKGQLVVLTPYTLSLKTCFEMPVATGRTVVAAEAHLIGFIRSLKLFTLETAYTNPEQYSKLVSVYKEDKVCFEGKMLLPILSKTRMTRTEPTERTFLKMDFEYDNGEKETITTDITQSIQEVANESPEEVTFNLLKVGGTATVVSWVAGTGSGEIN